MLVCYSVVCVVLPLFSWGDIYLCLPGDTMRTVVLPTAVVLMLCNMDRICMSVAMPTIAREMSWAPGIQVACRHET